MKRGIKYSRKRRIFYFMYDCNSIWHYLVSHFKLRYGETAKYTKAVFFILNKQGRLNFLWTKVSLIFDSYVIFGVFCYEVYFGRFTATNELISWLHKHLFIFSFFTYSSVFQKLKMISQKMFRTSKLSNLTNNT